jgi:beta-1,4-mannosyl-glycoprotein beta-1,4-N-acetylglucosaminyltransferase
MSISSLSASRDTHSLESNTFTGIDKGFNFSWDQVPDRYLEKVTYIPLDEGPNFNDPWANERRQREVMSFPLEDYKDTDWVILGDVDEIPDPELFAYDPERFYVFVATTCYYKLNWSSLEWDASKMIQLGKLREHFEGRLDKFRDYWHDMGSPVFPRRTSLYGGWHFSYMPDDGLSQEEAIRLKLRSFSHTEMATPRVVEVTVRNSTKMVDPRERRLFEIAIDKLPLYVRKNARHYRDIGWIA